MDEHEEHLQGRHGRIVVRHWAGPAAPSHVVVVAHGYGEHTGRYRRLAGALVESGAVVVAPDHVGHGLSEGERVLVESFADVVADLHDVAERVRGEHPGLPLVLLGHSMGGLIAARYVLQHPGEVDVLVLSSPVLGRWDPVTALLDAEEIPDVPLDPSTLSRDPEVGRVYAEDPLVWHGPFKRTTVQSLATTLDDIDAGLGIGELPALWIHGADDPLVPIEGTQEGVDRLLGSRLESRIYPGARHELFNETNQDEVTADVLGFIRESLPH